jgi:folate-binding protein YgfZ
VLRFVEVSGKDALDFLHRVTAGTVRGVEVGQGRAGLLLNGQSRVLAQFDLLRANTTRYLLAAPEECASQLAEALENLHFAEDLTIKLTETRAAAVPAGPAAVRAPDGVFAVNLDAVMIEWVSPVPGFDFSTSAVGIPPGWESARIAALVPWPGSEWTWGNTPALEAGMLPWIDRHKGCYPGQEVVELSLNVGHPVRVLVAVEGTGPWDGAAVTSFVQENGKWRALVRLPWAKKDILPSGISRLAAHW